MVDGVLVDVGGALPRRLLAALAVAGGKVVPDDRLVDAMWGSAPPPKPAIALQAYVSRIRTTLGPYRGRLERDTLGYRLTLDQLDAQQFSELVEEARAHLAKERAEPACRLLTEATGLWRGEAYPELPDEYVAAERGRLHELREAAAEDLAAARLASGDAVGAVVQLEQLVREQPLREHRWALLVLGLYRSDRQGDALAALRRIRKLLADELGVDPGTELTEIERQVLAQDPRLLLTEPPQLAAQIVPIRRPLTSFLGREIDLKTLTEHLAAQRLISLIGPAGVGKTRLAIEYAAGAPGSGRHGAASSSGASQEIWFARLADVREFGEVATAVADAMGLVVVDDDPAAAVVDAIGGGPATLVLDNCEHVVAAAAELADQLLQRCPRLRILVTSREPLGVEGEVTVPVEPLPWATAVALLTDRVRSVRPGWAPTDTDEKAARQIASRLDGLPLAIELAAARARVLSLAEIAERLDDRFALLGKVQHGSLAAHETLDAAIGWSVDLLADQDRRLLLRLWAFEGGFTLEAAETVSPDSAGPEVLESLSALVTRSVVVADTSAEPTRYLLLESIRAYCRRLDRDPAATAEGQASWVRLLAGRCTEAVRGRKAGSFMRMMSRELPNFRAGFAHDLEHHPAAALESAVGLGVFLYRSLHHGEAVKVLRTALAAAPDAPVLDRARALNSLTALNYFAGDLEAARELIDTVYRMLAELSADDHTPIEYAELCFFLAVGCAVTGQTERTREVTGKVIHHGRDELESMVRAARSVLGVAMLKEAVRTGDEAGMVAQVEALQYKFSRGWARAWLNIAVAEVYLRYPAPFPDSAEKALAAVRSAVTTFLAHEDYPYTLNVLQVGALALDRAGRPEDAVRLLGAVQAHARRLGLRTPGLLEPERPWVAEALGEPPAEELSWQGMVALLDAGEVQAESSTLGP